MKSLSNFFRLPFTNVFLFSLFWALQIFFSKLAYNTGVQPLAFIIQYAVVACVLMALVVLFTKINQFKKLSLQIFKEVFTANFIHSSGALMTNIGISLTLAINAAFLGKFALVGTLFFAWLILGEKLTRSKIITSAVMFIGIFFMTTNGRLIVPHAGDILILLAATAFALGNVLSRKTVKKNNLDPMIVSFLRSIMSPLLFLGFVALAPWFPKDLQPVFMVDVLHISIVPLIITVGLFSALLTIFLNRTLTVASASYMSMMSMMMPVMASILSISFLGEKFLPLQALGAVLIIVAGFTTHRLKIHSH